jgi:NitT/TauT family transport system ATP-binding protein
MRNVLLHVEHLTLRYRSEGRTVTATEDVSFNIDRGDRLVLLGPSGCGKSSLLKAIGGYMQPAAGSIVLGGTPVRGPGPDRVMVFQEFDQLLPWKTVRHNVLFALESSGKLKGKPAQHRAEQAIAKVGLTKFADAYPHTLSGGMKQRVAIARGMAMEPEVLLMDEPFAALDALTRQGMQDELMRLWDDMKFTLIFVTHSIQEAIRLGNRILLLSPHPGRVYGEVSSDGTDRLMDNGQLLSDFIHRTLFVPVEPAEPAAGIQV